MDAPGPSLLASIVRFPVFRNNELAGFRQGWKRYGDLYHVQVGRRDLWICSHPDLINEVLVTGRDTWQRIRRLPDGSQFGLSLVLGDSLLTTDGAEWQWRRRLVNPAFHRRRIDALADTMVDCGKAMLDRLAAAADTGAPIDLLGEMKHVTQDIISRTMFSADIAEDADRIGGAVDDAIQYVAKRSRAVVNVPMEWPTPAARNFRNAQRTLDDAIYRNIHERRAAPGYGGDLLGMLLEATDEETGQRLTDEEVRNEVATVYGAGHETTANGLTWAWHELMLRPGLVQRLHEEVDRVDFANGAPDPADLPLSRRTFDETLRYRPPVPVNARIATEPAQLGGYQVAPGAVAVLVVNNVHRHPDFWDHPDEFDPDRFTPERSAGRHRHAYAPFGAGPHLCVGNHFALLEGTMLLAMMAANFEFAPAARLPRSPALAVTMKPRRGLPTYVTAR